MSACPQQMHVQDVEEALGIHHRHTCVLSFATVLGAVDLANGVTTKRRLCGLSLSGMEWAVPEVVAAAASSQDRRIGKQIRYPVGQISLERYHSSATNLKLAALSNCLTKKCSAGLCRCSPWILHDLRAHPREVRPAGRT